MIAKLGTCQDAFNIKGQGVVLGFTLYTKDTIPLGEQVKAKLIRDGTEVDEINCEFGCVLAGKRHRYDMNPVSLIATGDIKKSDIIGCDVYLLCNYEFWQPEMST